MIFPRLNGSQRHKEGVGLLSDYSWRSGVVPEGSDKDWRGGDAAEFCVLIDC